MVHTLSVPSLQGTYRNLTLKKIKTYTPNINFYNKNTYHAAKPSEVQQLSLTFSLPKFCQIHERIWQKEKTKQFTYNFRILNKLSTWVFLSWRSSLIFFQNTLNNQSRKSFLHTQFFLLFFKPTNLVFQRSVTQGVG